MKNNYRLYSFVAGNYLSELQKGLQTAHVVGQLAWITFETSEHSTNNDVGLQDEVDAFNIWTRHDKTIIILNAYNHAGVDEVFQKFLDFNIEGLPYCRFNEDEQSMNNMSTAAGIIVPQKYYDAKTLITGDLGSSYFYEDEDGTMLHYPSTGVEAEFITFLKSYRLA